VILLSIVAPGMEKMFQKDNFSVDQLVETLRISLTTLMNVTKNAERMFRPARNQILPSKPEKRVMDIPQTRQNTSKIKATNTDSKKPQPKDSNAMVELMDLVNNGNGDSMEVEKPPSPTVSPIPPGLDQDNNDVAMFGTPSPPEQNLKKRKCKPGSERIDPRPRKQVKIPGFTDNGNTRRVTPPATVTVVKEERSVVKSTPSLPAPPKKKPTPDKKRYKVVVLKRIQSKVCAAEVEVQVEHVGSELPDSIKFRAQLSVNPCMDYIYKWVKKARKNIRVFPIRMDEEDPGWLAFRTHYLLRQTVGHCQMLVRRETHIFFLIPAFEQFLQYASDKLGLTLDPISSHVLRIRIPAKKTDKKPATRRDQAERRQASDDEKKREGTRPKREEERNRKHRSQRQAVPQKPVFKRTQDYGYGQAKGKKKSLPTRIPTVKSRSSKTEVILLDP